MNNSFARDTYERLNVHVKQEDRFKTFVIQLNVGFPLTADTVTPLSLIAHIMRRANARFPQSASFREYLEDLYGAAFSVELDKRGHYQMISISLEMVEQRFIDEPRNMLHEGLQFLFDSLLRPASQNEAFIDQFVQEECAAITRKSAAIVNDKAVYAATRCMEIMCAEDVYRLPVIGLEHELAKWNGHRLYTFFREHWLPEARFDLHVVGATDVQEVLNILETLDLRELKKNHLAEQKTYETIRSKPVREFPIEHVEHLQVTQGKLNIGLTFAISQSANAFPSLVFANAILGGFSQSKLFLNVREKHSLAYYAASKIVDSALGFMMIQTGIEIEKKQAALDIIRKQLDDLQNGQITDSEWLQTRELLLNGLRAVTDSPNAQIEFDFSGLFKGQIRTLKQSMEQIESVDKAAICAAAQTIRMDTIYFLRD